MRTILNAVYVAAAMLAFASVSASAATVRYSYTGADPSTFTGTQTYPQGAPVLPWIPNQVSGWVEVTNGLAANLINADVSNLVSKWSFESVDNILNSVTAAYFGCGPAPCFRMAVSTDAQGAITEWSLNAFSGLPTPETAQLITRFFINPINPNGESISILEPGGFPFGQMSYSASSASVGSWSATVVPIPAAAYLFASGLGLLGWMRRRQLS
jgi:hypothetical protein